MRIIGLTGGIGTGKSTAAAYLKKRGLKHIDADKISRNLTALGSSLLPVLDGVFGPNGDMGLCGVKIIKKDGALDRKALASVVFSDKKKTARLNELMFTEIINRIEEEITAFDKSKTEAVLIDAPLLFESGLNKRCDIVILMTADMDTRIKRVSCRDHVTADDVRNRINNQMSDKEKAAGSDVIIDNSGSKEELYTKLDDFLANIICQI